MPKSGSGTATGCSLPTGDCLNETLDGNLDLWVKDSTGGIACASSTFNGSWEMCDSAVNAGAQYTAQFKKFVTTASLTYLGIAWSNYTTASE